MATTLVKVANFGPLFAGLATVGYKLVNAVGGIVVARTTVGVVEVAPGSYQAPVSFPNGFQGSIVWDDVNPAPNVSTVEDINPKDLIDLSLVRKILTNRWKVDTVAKTLTFYDDDNTTVIAQFNLKDQFNNPTFSSVFERIPF